MLELPLDDPDRPPAWAEETVNAARWWTVHCTHPEVAQALFDLAWPLVAGGARRIGIAMLWETLRYRSMLGELPGARWRLDNRHRAYYARWLMEQHPQLRGVFETRSLHGLPG